MQRIVGLRQCGTGPGCAPLWIGAAGRRPGQLGLGSLDAWADAAGRQKAESRRQRPARLTALSVPCATSEKTRCFLPGLLLPSRVPMLAWPDTRPLREWQCAALDALRSH